MQTYLILAEFLPDEYLGDNSWLCVIVAESPEKAQELAAARCAMARKTIRKIGIMQPENVGNNVITIANIYGEEGFLAEAAKKTEVFLPEDFVKEANKPNMHLDPTDPLVVSYGDEANAWLEKNNIARFYHPAGNSLCANGMVSATRQIGFSIRLEEKNTDIDDLVKQMEFLLDYIKPSPCGVDVDNLDEYTRDETSMQMFSLMEKTLSEYGIYTIGHRDGTWYMFKTTYGNTNLKAADKDLRHFLHITRVRRGMKK